MGNDKPRNSIEFRVWGRSALFTDPLTKLGGERCSYHVPTYEALKGITKSIYWKPTIVWVIDKVRVLSRIRTQTKSLKPLDYSAGGNTLSIYNYLIDVNYEVQAHFVWNEHRDELTQDRNEGKHYSMARRMLEVGGRQDVFLGTRDCQGYVEAAPFGSNKGYFDGSGEITFGLMFHGFNYPDETGVNTLSARFWNPRMVDGVIEFLSPGKCSIVKDIRPMAPKKFVVGENIELLGEE